MRIAREGSEKHHLHVERKRHLHRAHPIARFLALLLILQLLLTAGASSSVAESGQVAASGGRYENLSLSPADGKVFEAGESIPYAAKVSLSQTNLISSAFSGVSDLFGTGWFTYSRVWLELCDARGVVMLLLDDHDYNYRASVDYSTSATLGALNPGEYSLRLRTRYSFGDYTLCEHRFLVKEADTTTENTDSQPPKPQSDAPLVDQLVNNVNFFARYPDYQPVGRLSSGAQGDWTWWTYLRTSGAEILYVVNCNSYVSLRAEASTESARLMKVPLKTRLDCYGRCGSWALCEFNGLHGWIHRDYLTEDKPTNRNNNNNSDNPPAANGGNTTDSYEPPRQDDAVQWSSWSDWSMEPVSASDTRQVEVQEDYITTTEDVYSYSRWAYYNTAYSTTYYSYSQYEGESYLEGSGQWEEKTTSSPLSKTKVISGHQQYEGYWYNESVATNEYTQVDTYYRYRDRLN